MISALMPTVMADALGYDPEGNCPRLLCDDDRLAMDAGLIFRAGGDAPCIICGSLLRQHPAVQGALWLRRACTGLVKL